jgi:hypothetical protein
MSKPEGADFAWNPQDYKFNPYELTVQPVENSDKDKVDKRRPGRAKRLSVLCQVKGFG